MSIKHSILALLDDGPSHGYQLKADFEDRTGGTWMLNIGQVYSTLQRLERDGLVVPVGDDGDERHTYALTADGRAALDEWFAAPVASQAPPRDELALKVLLAVAADGVDVIDLLQRQRTATIEQLQEHTRLKAGADPDRELSWVLVLDALILRAEADIRWLDLCEQRLHERHRGLGTEVGA